MEEADRLGAARGQLAGLLDHAEQLPGEVSLDICAALIALDRIQPLRPDTDRPAEDLPPEEVLRQARATLRAAIRHAGNPYRCLPIAAAVGHVDDALVGLVS